MLTIHSPKFSTGKTQITKQSPTFRHKRAPSAQDNYTLQSKSKASMDSPAKLSEGKKHKKSRSQLQPPMSMHSKSGKQKGRRQIIDSIQTLKQQYRTLKQAYKQLIQQRLKNRDVISSIRAQNKQLHQQNERLHRQNQRIKLQASFLQQQHDRTRREFRKLLEVQKFKAQKLQQSLVQKQQYINMTLDKIRTQGDQVIRYPKIHIPTVQQDVSLTISQDKSAVLNDHSINNQSQFLSFSLTSVLQESTDKQPSTSKRRHDHSRVASDIPPQKVVEEDRKKQLPSFRKKKEIPKLELHSIQSKTQLIPTIVHQKHTEKKLPRQKQSKSYRQKENRQTLSNNNKKKSKKVINISNLSDY